MAINKFQRSRLTFELRSFIFESHQYFKTMFFSQTIGPIELKFHVKTPYEKLTKIYAKYIDHMTKMTATFIYGKKNILKSSPEPEGCDAPFTIGHFLLECGDFAQVRNNCFHVDNMKELFQDIHIDSIMTFLRLINLFNKI